MIMQENYVGDLMFSLAYLPASERLIVVVMKARNIRCCSGSNDKKLPDSYVKVKLWSGGGDANANANNAAAAVANHTYSNGYGFISSTNKKVKKKKTSTQKASSVPVYNEEIVFTHVSKEQLNEIVLTFDVCHDSLTHKELLGTMSISAAAKGEGYFQWRDMLNGRKSIAWWHPLQPAATLGTESDYVSTGESSSNAHASVARKGSRLRSIDLTKLNLKSLSLLNHR